MTDIEFPAWLNHQWTLTAALIIGLTLLRIGISHAIRRDAAILTESQRQSLARVRNLQVSAIVIGLIAIWSVELRTMALSLAAFAVAIVIALKEVLLCIIGSLVMRSGKRSFRIGDWIQVGHHRGEVLDHNLLSTTLQEVQAAGNRHYTGKTLVIPNIIFLSQPVVNLNFSKWFVFQTFKLPLKHVTHWRAAVAAVEQRIEELTEPFIDRARVYNEAIEKRAGVDLPEADPQVAVQAAEDGDIWIKVTLFCPRQMVTELNRELIAVVLDHSGPAESGHAS
ncbi:MAG: mechanosensitive ion channel family protein [Wenzhouxiangellaceae bacterium]